MHSIALWEPYIHAEKGNTLCELYNQTPRVSAFALEGSQGIISVNVPCEIHSYSEGKVNVLVAQWVSDSLQLHGLWPSRLLCPWNYPGKTTGEGSHSLLQGNLPHPGLNPSLLDYRHTIHLLSHQGSPIFI